MGGARNRRRLVPLLSGGLLLGGIVLVGLSAVAMAGGSISISPDTGLSNGQSVTVSGSGFANSSAANILECNDAPNEPVVDLPSPVSSQVSVGCSAPSLTSGLTSTSSTGTVSKAFTVVTGTVGPPCGTSGAIVATCPSTDSAGISPATDAANYPCPPTPAQQAQGVTCSLNFGDQAGDAANATILFTGESAPTTTTTAAPTTTTTAAHASTTIAPTTTATTGSLAATGPGPQLWWTAYLGLGLICLSALLWMAARRSWRS